MGDGVGSADKQTNPKMHMKHAEAMTIREIVQTVYFGFA